MSDSDKQADEVPMLNVQIDGEWHKFPKGTRMIEACQAVKAEVPHYCYHPKLTSPGNCRMCLVEMGMPPRLAPDQKPELDENGHQKIGWMPRPAIACANTIADGMGIRTQSELAKGCRHGVMELLLINHPLDCPICDQAGECRLQEHSVEHGTGGSRFREQKVKKPKNVDIGPRIRLDDERCIMCSRCIRFTDEIADDPVLGFTDRGSHTTLAVHPGRELANNYSLNTVDICPVGALTSNDFRFEMRVWFLKEIESIDVNCGTGCNILIHSREGKLYRITPRDNNDVNSAWIPDSHRLNFHYVDSEARLAEPLVKSNGDEVHRVDSWANIIAQSADALRQHHAAEIAVIASGRMTNEEMFLTKRLANALGVSSDHLDIVPRTGEDDGYLISADRNSNTNGAKLILGIETPGAQLDGIRKDIEDGKIKALLVLGEDLLHDGSGDDLAKPGFTAAQLEKLDTLVVSHILANPTADAARFVLPSAAWCEKRGSMINVTGRLQRLNAATQAPGQARDDWEILRDLILAVGGGNGIHLIEDVFRDLANSVKEFEGLTLSKITSQGVPLIETGEKIPLLEKERERIASGMIVG